MIYSTILQFKKERKKGFAVLIDPDKVNWDTLSMLIQNSIHAKVSFFFIGGSLVSNYILEQLIDYIKKTCSIPVVLFPGNNLHITSNADAILFLSLISGRNPDFLIGHHVIAAPILKQSKIEIIPTSYLLIDGDKKTSVSYISNTTPIPADQINIAKCTAMAGEMLGHQLIFMDAGSGANNHVPVKMVFEVKKELNNPLIIGGGINNANKAKLILEAGADMIVVGNGIEKNIGLIQEIGEVVNSFN
ncbi:geranylgeranylglyceryl/heptaprenylglyceryl phosphate synthase [Arcicella sp. LKC2W]|uniref:geranylgeranylglyceryl/heptaprenylglyceryl phosphate synthase n=1 Tax=Arcicella sp. LKC2W TaxID=2984198 RepID=UPI002B209D26|nr:geranylgeranylglyceryl/heptaprenylglyceryl phosphate synthase [Arcicella sp. LKC2W]MEA5458978.1 geranylgeranylglyceryl/heptaprenylglyceryl phosphate synthase [Arcicella sp. LKC2W]